MPPMLDLARIDHKTKPLGSLGRLEGLALQLGPIQQSEAPSLVDPQVVIFAGDQGLQPLVLQRCVFAHQSDESVHARMLAYLKVEPSLKLDLCLGEGEMVSFDSVGVCGSTGQGA